MQVEKIKTIQSQPAKVSMLLPARGTNATHTYVVAFAFFMALCVKLIFSGQRDAREIPPQNAQEWEVRLLLGTFSTCLIAACTGRSAWWREKEKKAFSLPRALLARVSGPA